MLKFITVSFDFGTEKIFETLANVLSYSIEKHEPEADFIHYRLPEPCLNDRVKGYVTNTVKLQTWLSELNKTDDGDCLVFLDADMLLIKPIHSIFDKDFDIAYTHRTASTYPINGGIIYVKVNDRSRNFMKRFLETNMKMFNDQKFHYEYRKKYAGMNQSALGYMIENEKTQCKLLSIPCSEWNSCGEDWPDMNEQTRVLHIKGQLRKALFGGVIEHEVTKPALIWLDYFNNSGAPNV